ncbi:MAG: LEA type 2 family protein [Spirochaetaceae bacterium]|jgi:LEA14-like dessication related protein|nr:LEA type 2 family protein [Spirochaetaceae bacterium]
MIRFSCVILLGALIFSCKTSEPPLRPAPPPAQAQADLAPWGALSFERLTAEDPDRFTLYFALEIENPRADRAEIAIEGWHIAISGQGPPKGAALRLVSESPHVEPRSRACFSLGLDVDMAGFSPKEGGGIAEYEAALEVTLGLAFGRRAAEAVLVRSEAVIPRIQEPEFTITAIAVSRAEQTRFRVSLQIANPNQFPLELSSLTYTFYGDGALWADGKKELLLPIPAGSSAETQVFLMTSGLEVHRSWQDELDQLTQVQYRLTGESMIHTNIIFLPAFRMDFDLSRPLRGF